MALTQLLFGKRDSKKIGGIEIDAFVEESHEHTCDVTDYPVEGGFVISDHVVQNPDRLSIQGFIGSSNIYASSEDQDITRPYDMYLQLEALKVKGDPITVVTGLQVYEDMVIEAFRINRTAENGKSLAFDMTLRKVKIVKSQTKVISTKTAGTTKTKKQVQSPVKVGKTQGTEVKTEPKKTTFMDEIRRSMGVKLK